MDGIFYRIQCDGQVLHFFGKTGFEQKLLQQGIISIKIPEEVTVLSFQGLHLFHKPAAGRIWLYRKDIDEESKRKFRI
ncbi:hypothetical protein KP014_27365 [Paenibacillus sophorae]|uniref:Uncharacterized protein n=1 Tax=Paenibacillus sophorae TaxID=1333845 RepID=A0ABX8HB93_9BACL|nr:hypothetical protein [Paenibacillus sophorae]QWU15526.1 hypothetical protein KP014_27365 [Paenibacillus sophorae]